MVRENPHAARYFRTSFLYATTARLCRFLACTACLNALLILACNFLRDLVIVHLQPRNIIPPTAGVQRGRVATLLSTSIGL